MENDSRFNLSGEERNNLKRRIMDSIVQEKRRRRTARIVFSAAASVIISLSSVLYFYVYQDRAPDIGAFASSTAPRNLDKLTSVAIVLGDSSVHEVQGDDGKISYATTGETVNLGSGGKVEQSVTSGDKPVFNTVLVPYGKRSEVTFTDGTIVWLNSGSRLIYPAKFGDDSREVYLEGEGIFDVTHDPDRPFRVLSKTQSVEVLGTVFSVTHYDDDATMHTVLKSGSVKVTYKNDANSSLKITPGTLISYRPQIGVIEKQQVDPDDYMSWKEGYLKFNNDNLQYIMTKLSRYYNADIRIESQGLSTQKFSGSLDLREDLNEVLSMIQTTAGFETKLVNNTILITKSN